MSETESHGMHIHEQVRDRIAMIECALERYETGHGDYTALCNAATACLGPDQLVDQRTAEFHALPQDQRCEMERSGQYGIYSISYLVGLPEVPLALAVVARELSADFRIHAEYKRQLREPEVAQRITERFPAISLQRIQLALL